MPRMSTDERDLIENPANALIIYNTNVQAIEFNVGTEPYLGFIIRAR
jgi:hypothetical protein